tara:strand:+ start:5358 stop:6257 length:900 start_codon:yes stop_codon:yes gene_type:complete
MSAFYNEEENLEKFIKNFEITRSQLLKKGYSVNLILVNDGSTDESIKIVKKKISSKKFIELISLDKNYGQQIAIYIALKEKKADFYGAIDSDCQQNSNFFIKMIDRLRSNKLELLQMKKKYGNYEGAIKKFLSKVFYYVFSHLANINIQPGSSDFYLFTNKVRNKIISTSISKFFLRGFIHWNNFKKEYLEYTPSKRTKGKSKYNVYKQLDFALTAMYLYGKKMFVKMFIFLIFLSISFIIYLFFKDYFLSSEITELLIVKILITFFGVINLFLCCTLTFFIIKFRQNISIKPRYKFEK